MSLAESNVLFAYFGTFLNLSPMGTEYCTVVPILASEDGLNANFGPWALGLHCLLQKRVYV